MPEEFRLDDEEMQSTLTELRSNESGGASEEESRAVSPSGTVPDGAASSSPADGAFKAPQGTEKAAMTAALGNEPTRQQVEAWRAMPKSWKKEMEQEWSATPDKAKQYVHERETQALDGIRQYKSVADKWTSTYTPYKQWFDHYKIDPYDAFNRLASTHIILKYGKPEDRQKYAQQLIRDYGLDSFLQSQGQPQQGQIPPEILESVYGLRNEVDGLKAQQYEKELASKREAVTTFFNDQKNEFAMDLKDDILQILELGAATSLEQAYEIAKWQNPSVRERLLMREIENATKPKRTGPSNIKPSSVPASPTDGADESIDDTMRATLGRINSR
jgi:hypothetical protein